MSDLASSSAHRDKGLMSPNYRRRELQRILKELRTPDDAMAGKTLVPTRAEEDGAQDVCYRLYSEEVADLIAARLGTTRQAVREALDAALRWTDHLEPSPASGNEPGGERPGWMERWRRWRCKVFGHRIRAVGLRYKGTFCTRCYEADPEVTK